MAVGVSIDGSREFHDEMRPDKRGRGSYDDAVAGLRKLQSAVRAGKLRSAGVLAVVPDGPSGKAVLDHLITELAVSSPGLNFPRGGWDCSDTSSWNANGEQRRSLVRAWLAEHTYPNFHYIRDLGDLLFGMMSSSGAERLDLRNSKRHHVLTISSRGDLLVDDNLLGQVPAPASPLSVVNNTFLEFLRSSEWQSLEEAMNFVAPKCADCVWQRPCHGGALYNRHSGDNYLNHSAICDVLQIFNEEVAQYLVDRNIVSAESLVERLSSPPIHTAASVYNEMVRAARSDR